MQQNHRIVLTQTRRVDDRTGREVTRYIPSLVTDCTASGSLSFAFYEVWTDESYDKHERARRNAEANAASVLASIARELASLADKKTRQSANCWRAKQDTLRKQ